jgi:hypothetical protein
MLTKDEAVLKVRKLLRLSQSSNRHEAALAAQRAQEILDRYKLTSAMLDADEPEAVECTARDGAQLDTFSANVTTWKSYLSAVVARANGCRTFIQCEWLFPHKNKIAVLHVVGAKSDIEKVRYIYLWTTHEIAKLLELHGKKRGKTWRNNFRIGVVDAIKEKLNKSQENAISDLKTRYQNNPLALVKLDQAICRISDRLTAADAWIAQHLDVSEKKQPNIMHDQVARDFGRTCGKKLDLKRSSRKYLPEATV